MCESLKFNLNELNFNFHTYFFFFATRQKNPKIFAVQPTQPTPDASPTERVMTLAMHLGTISFEVS